MKIIDERGKLFGKINVIDFFVIMFLFCFIPAFYFSYELFTKKEKIKEFIVIETSCKFIKVEPEVLKLIAIGDKEMNDKGAAIGEIIWLGESKPYQHKFNIGGDNVITKEDSELKEVYAKVRLNAEVRNNVLYYKDKRLTVDSPIYLKTDRYTATTIPFIEKSIEKKDVLIELYVTFKELNEDLIKLISVGDKELGKNGEVIAEILNIGKIDNSTREINLGEGNFALSEDSYKKQVNAKVRLICQITDKKELYFKGEKVLQDSLIEFKTNKYTMNGKIAKSYEEPVSPVEKKWFRIHVKFSGVIPELANVITEGDTEKSPEGKVMGNLNKIISNKPSEVLILKENQWIMMSHPFYKDIVVILNIQTSEKEGILYFKNYPVRLGNAVTFTTDLYSVSGTIIGLGD